MAPVPRCVLLLVLGLAAACHPRPRPTAPTAPAVDPAYAHELRAWRAERLRKLTARDSWLALAGLFWLKPGASAMGSAPDSAVLWPSPAPARVGVVSLDTAGTVSFRPASGVRALLGAAPLAGPTVLRADHQRGGPDRVAVGQFSFVIIQRGGKLALRLYDNRSATRTGFRGIDHFTTRPALRIRARFQAHAKPRQVQVPTVINTTERATITGVLRFAVAGVACQLSPFSFPGSKDLFINFGDTTNARQSYGGGRFLSAKMPVDGVVVLDFNKAFNPPCAFTPYGTCPVPLAENRLPVGIRAGEKAYP